MLRSKHAGLNELGPAAETGRPPEELSCRLLALRPHPPFQVLFDRSRGAPARPPAAPCPGGRVAKGTRAVHGDGQRAGRRLGSREGVIVSPKPWHRRGLCPPWGRPPRRRHGGGSAGSHRCHVVVAGRGPDEDPERWTSRPGPSPGGRAELGAGGFQIEGASSGLQRRCTVRGARCHVLPGGDAGAARRAPPSSLRTASRMSRQRWPRERGEVTGTPTSAPCRRLRAGEASVERG